ncbi:MAG: ABC transporter substrate-binding protein [Rhodospirillales bacterium]
MNGSGRFFRSLTLAAGAMLLSVAAQAADVTDVAGRTVTVNTPVKRIILGEGRQIYAIAPLERENPFGHVVGWKDDMILYDPDAYRKYLAKFPALADMTNFGSPYAADFSVEKAIAVDADLVILNLGEYMKAQETGIIEKLEKAGIPVVFIDFRQRPTQNTVPSIQLLGRLLGREQEAQAFNDFYLKQMRLVYTRTVDKPEDKKPLVFVERAAGYNPNKCCSTFGSANLGRLVEEAGGRNWGSTMFTGFSGNINPEQLFVTDPDIIIGTGANWSEAVPDTTAVLLGYEADMAMAQERMAALASRPGWETLKAVKTKQFYSMYHQFYNNPYHFVAVQAFAKWFYPEDFRDIDPNATMTELHDRFLPISNEGLFWAQLQ